MDALERLETTIQGVLNENVSNIKAQFEEDRRSRMLLDHVFFMVIVVDPNLGDASFDQERANYHEQIEDLRENLSQLDRVREENKGLKAQIDVGDKRPTVLAGTVPLEEFENVKDQLQRCRVEYGKLSAARDMLETRCRHYGELLKEWKKYSRDYMKRHSEACRGQNFKSSMTRPQSVNALNGKSESDPPPPIYAGSTPFSSSASRSASPNREVPLHIHAHAHNAQAHPAEQAPTLPMPTKDIRSTSDDLAETSDDSEAPASIVQGDGKPVKAAAPLHSPKCKVENTGGSSPIVVHERSLKRMGRNRQSVNGKKAHEDASAKHEHMRKGQIKVEKEQPSSSPLQPSRLVNQQGYTGDSLDLDEVGGTLYTPRKRQRLELMRRQSSGLAPFDDNFAPRYDDILEEEDLHNKIDRRSALHFDHAKVGDENLEILASGDEAEGTHYDSDRQVGQQHGEDGGRKIGKKNSLLLPGGRGLRAQDQVISRNVLHGSAASPKTEPFILPRTDSERPTKTHQCPSRHDRGSAHVPALAEDGEAGANVNGRDCDLQTSNANLEKTPTAIDAHRRLGHLLNHPSSGKASLSGGPNQTRPSDNIGLPAPRRQSKQRETTAFATPQSLPATKKARIAQARVSKSAQQPRTKCTNPITYSRKRPLSGNGISEILPEHEPLRARPLHRLRLEDFKLNPGHSNYAYHESIRKHDEKKKRNGCTDPFCQRCKDFRKFVEMSGYSTSKTVALFDTSPPDGVSTDFDEKLLREFLGSDAYRIPMMCEKEKQDLILKAKTKQFMDRFGKHRQTFSKPPEPPGFWMTEFPSTQENEQFAEEARVIERAKIEERREEALRGGTWLFADEV